MNPSAERARQLGWRRRKEGHSLWEKESPVSDTGGREKKNLEDSDLAAFVGDSTGGKYELKRGTEKY